MEAERSEMYKTLVVDYELALERKVLSHRDEIEVLIICITLWSGSTRFENCEIVNRIVGFFGL